MNTLKQILILPFFLSATVVFGQSVAEMKEKLADLHGSQKVMLLNELTLATWLINPEEAMEYAQEAYRISQAIEDSALISVSVRLIGGVNFYKGNFDLAVHFADQAYVIAESIQDSSLMASALNNEGIAFYFLGSYHNALENLLKALQIRRGLEQTYGLALNLNNIGLVYDRLEDYEESRKYLFEALQAARKLGEKDEELYSLNNLATSYVLEGNLDAAEIYLTDALKMQVENRNWKSVTHARLGEILTLRNQLDSARYHLNESLRLRQELGERRGLSESYYLLAKLALQNQNYQETLVNLEKSQEEAVRIGARDRILENLELYAQTYDRLGDLNSAYQYLSEYVSLEDELFNETLARNLAETERKLDEEENRRRLEAQQRELLESRRMTFFLTIIVVLTITLLFVILDFYRRNKRNTILLEERTHDLERSLEELTKAQKQLIESEKLVSLGTLSAGIGHEINNPLNFISGGVAGIKDLLDSEDKITTDDLEPYIDVVEEGVQRATAIVKSLSHFSRETKALDEECDMHDILDNCLIMLQNVTKHKIEIHKDYGKRAASLLGNEGRLHQVFLNMISNAIQAIQDEGEIRLKTRVRKEEIEIHISDNGCGISEEHLSRISDPFFTTKDPGQGTGLGLSISYKIIEEHGGHVDVSSEVGKGTTFTIILPRRNAL